MSDPTDYPRKLAEAMRDKLAVRHPERESMIGCLTAALASEGVVDPEMSRISFETMRATAVTRQHTIDALRAEVERLEAAAGGSGHDACRRNEEMLGETIDSLTAEVERLEALEATYAWMPFEVAVLSIGDRSFSVDPDVIAEFERLKAIADGHVQATEISVIAAEAQGVCVGREQAAKIAKDHSHQHPRDLLPSIIAAAIQAKKEQLYE